jgi:hypothetical protein
MLIVGVDSHSGFQQIAFGDQETGEYDERRLNHSDGETERFYRELKQRGVRVRVGMEATGYSRWFERLLAELGFELWTGDPAEIKTKRVWKQKTDRQDAHLLNLLLKDRFLRTWVPNHGLCPTNCCRACTFPSSERSASGSMDLRSPFSKSPRM